MKLMESRYHEIVSLLILFSPCRSNAYCSCATSMLYWMLCNGKHQDEYKMYTFSWPRGTLSQMKQAISSHFSPCCVRTSNSEITVIQHLKRTNPGIWELGERKAHFWWRRNEWQRFPEDVVFNLVQTLGDGLGASKRTWSRGRVWPQNWRQKEATLSLTGTEWSERHTDYLPSFGKD